jgi:methionyl-tRNA synthetase
LATLRTIVSGIAEYYNPEDIIGKQISVVANLEPRKIKGIESKGMILMAEDKDGRLVMVSAVDPVSNGSTVSSKIVIGISVNRFIIHQ